MRQSERRSIRGPLAVGGLVLIALLWAHALQGQVSTGAAGSVANPFVAQKVTCAPTVDGELEPVWKAAPLARIPLDRHSDPAGMALQVELRALYDEHTLFFFAAWEEDAPAFSGSNFRNRFVIHFDQEEPWPGARDFACLVACHTAFSDGSGGLAHMLAETIPQAASGPLPAAGGWSDGQWRLEWSRPLVNDNLFDVQFDDLDASYRFFVKVFEWVEGRADPVSEDLALVFGG